MDHVISIIRNRFDSDDPDRGIISNVYIDNVFVCDLIEPPVLSKYGCIEAGEYSLIYKYSPSFRKKMYYLDMQKVGSTRSGIMFHAGNRASDSKGCLIPGYQAIKGSFVLASSRIALSVIEENIANFGVNNVKVKIFDCYAK